MLISEAISDIRTQNLVLPEFQREYVWSREQAKQRFRLLVGYAHFITIRCRRPATSNFGPASVVGSAPTWAAHYVSSSSATFSETPAWAA